jgi:SAM-dependent methyltransferase
MEIIVDDYLLNWNQFDQKMSRDDLITVYWQFHPKYRFLKYMPLNSRLFDCGTGSGGLIHWKSWNNPSRADIEMSGLDLEKGEFTNRYIEWKKCDLNNEPIPFKEGGFDGIICSHVMEHIDDPALLLKKLTKLLTPKGKIYIECPNFNSLKLPNRDKFKAKGIQATITNFHDDHTHIKPVSMEIFVELVSDTDGLKIVEMADIGCDYLRDALLSYAWKHKDGECATYGFWLQSKWCTYAILERS